MSYLYKDIQGTPRERSLFMALVKLYEACETAHRNKPEDWERMGRAKYIAQQAIDSAIQNTPPKTTQEEKK